MSNSDCRTFSITDDTARRWHHTIAAPTIETAAQELERQFNAYGDTFAAVTAYADRVLVQSGPEYYPQFLYLAEEVAA